MRHLIWLALPLSTALTLAQQAGFSNNGSAGGGFSANGYSNNGSTRGGGAVIARVYAAPVGGYGGISYVTRRTPMVNANLIAGDFFRGSGLPLITATAAGVNGTGNAPGYGGARGQVVGTSYLGQRTAAPPRAGTLAANTPDRPAANARQPGSPGRAVTDRTSPPALAANLNALAAATPDAQPDTRAWR